MTTAEKTTAVIALLGALGVGALLKSWVDHLLSRGERRVNMADKTVQMASSVMSMVDTMTAKSEELAGVREELAGARRELALLQRENEDLRAVARATSTGSVEESAQRERVESYLREMDKSLKQAEMALSAVEVDMREVRSTPLAQAWAAAAARRDAGGLPFRLLQRLSETSLQPPKPGNALDGYDGPGATDVG